MNSPLLSLVAGLALSVGTCPAEIIFHETFAKGRETQNPPESLAWFSVVPDAVKVENNALVVSGAEVSPRAVIASFPEVTLQSGDRMVLTFDMTLDGEIGCRNGPLRVGLYSLEQPPMSDGTDPGTIGTGYLVSISHGQHSGSGNPYTGAMFFERVSDEQQKADPKITAFQNHLKLGASGVRPGFYEAGVPYSVEFAIEPVSAEKVRLGFRISGGTFTDQNDFDHEAEGSLGQAFTQFDSIVFLLTATPGDNLGGFPKATFSNIKLEIFRK